MVKSRPFPKSESTTGVVNLDIEIPSPDTRVGVDVALWDQEGLGLQKGKRLNYDATAWVKFQPPNTVGARLISHEAPTG